MVRGLRVYGDYKFDQPAQWNFTGQNWSFDPLVLNKEDDFWATNRLESLMLIEKGIYKIVGYLKNGAPNLKAL